MLDARLDQPDPQPISLSHCYEITTSEKPYLGIDREKKTVTPECDSARHSALIAGRRKSPKDPSVCQYLLRHSWGENCNEIDVASRWECTRGSIWVDADELVANTYKIQYLESPDIKQK
jgi:hypothetical protein